MTDLEYLLIKEAVKKEIIQEMMTKKAVKTDSLNMEVRKKQQIIFDNFFPDFRQSDAGRYWRAKEAIVKLTNICRFRSEKCSSWDSSIRTETEAESAISTYEILCKIAAELIGR